LCEDNSCDDFEWYLRDENKDGIDDLECDCCEGLTGNVDGKADQGPEVDLGDIAALIDYLFINNTLPDCMLEANVDGSTEGILVDIGDLTALIDYLFITFTPPKPCPGYEGGETLSSLEYTQEDYKEVKEIINEAIKTKDVEVLDELLELDEEVRRR